jgi:hypothetical protein
MRQHRAKLESALHGALPRDFRFVATPRRSLFFTGGVVPLLAYFTSPRG